MTITIKLKTDNAAFEDDTISEVERILAEWLRNGVVDAKLRDINGNTVGSVAVEYED